MRHEDMFCHGSHALTAMSREGIMGPAVYLSPLLGLLTRFCLPPSLAPASRSPL